VKSVKSIKVNKKRKNIFENDTNLKQLLDNYRKHENIDDNIFSNSCDEITECNNSDLKLNEESNIDIKSEVDNENVMEIKSKLKKEKKEI